MWKFKACPHCGGDVFITVGLDGWYEHYLQCGYECELRNISVSGVQAETKKVPVLMQKESGESAST